MMRDIVFQQVLGGQYRLEIHLGWDGHARFFDTLQHFFNIPDEQVGKRSRGVVIALPASLPLGNLLHLHLQLLEMLALLCRRPRTSQILITSLLAKLHPSQLISVIVHNHKILEFEVHEDDVSYECISFDEVSEHQFDVMEGVILFQKLLETAIFLYFLEPNALKRRAFVMILLTLDDCLNLISLNPQSLPQTLRPRQQQIPRRHLPFLLIIINPLTAGLYFLLFADPLAHADNIIQIDNEVFKQIYTQVFPSQRRRDKHDGCEMVGLRLGFLEVEESVQTGRLLFELLDPLVEHGEGELILAAFVLVAMIDDYGVEIAPLWYFWGQAVLAPHLLLSLLDPQFDCLDQMEQLSWLTLVGINEGYYLGDVVFVLLLRTDFLYALFALHLLTVFLQFQVLLCRFFLLLGLAFLCSRQAVGEKAEQVDQSTRVFEQCVGWQFALCDLAGPPADDFFELARVLKRDGEEFSDQQEMEQLFLDFGVHEDLIGHVGDECGQVDTLGEPALTHYSVYLSKRDHVFALEAFPSAHASLVVLPESQLIEVLDERDKNILGIVLLKGQVGVDVSEGGDGRWVEVLIRNGGFRRD